MYGSRASAGYCFHFITPSPHTYCLDRDFGTQIRHNIITKSSSDKDMKEIDDTNPTKINECENCDRLAIHVNGVAAHLRAHALVCQERIEALERQVANLEARKPPQDTNPDPEWFS